MTNNAVIKVDKSIKNVVEIRLYEVYESRQVENLWLLINEAN